jgi:hypothetical protein
MPRPQAEREAELSGLVEAYANIRFDPTLRVCIVKNELAEFHQNGGIGTANSGLLMSLIKKGMRPSVIYTAELDLDTKSTKGEIETLRSMLMRRSLAERLGGFDEDYVIGDFEDADMCERLRADGLGLGVDHGVTFYHLERQSQAGPGLRWRQNLTTYNAWLFGQRHPEQISRNGARREH